MAFAGQRGTWRFCYQAPATLPKGAQLKFDMQSPGRSIDWEQPQISGRAANNVIYALMPDGEVLSCNEVETPDSIVPQFEFILPTDLLEEQVFTIVMGHPNKKGKSAEQHGTVCQTVVQRRRQFLLYIDPKGKGNYGEPEAFSLDIRGNVLHQIRVLAPSIVARNKRFDITIRFEDAYGNLTASAPEDTLIDLSYENLRENLNWKLFVPETGFVVLPNLYFNEPGVYRIKLENLANKESFISAPIKCFSETAVQLFWGLLHGESERVDSTENVESYLRHCRDDLNLNFVSTSGFDDPEETPNEIWKLISLNVANFNEEDRFISMLGFQWQGEIPREGTRLMLWAKDNKPILRRRELKGNSLEKIYRTIQPKELISIPTFTMGNKMGFDFKEFNPEFERVVEIYNAWGSSECPAVKGNPRPIACAGRKGVKEFVEGSIHQALANNHRFGFVAGGLDDRGPYATFFDDQQQQYSPGLTAILAEKYTRESQIQALYNRSCYATTGARIILGLTLAGVPIGGELSTSDKPGLRVNRHIAGFVAGTTPLTSVEIVRNGKVITSLELDGDHKLDFTFDDMDPLGDVVFETEEGGFVYYYLRVTQKDEHMAWSSPIWVDHAQSPS